MGMGKKGNFSARRAQGVEAASSKQLPPLSASIMLHLLPKEAAKSDISGQSLSWVYMCITASVN